MTRTRGVLDLQRRGYQTGRLRMGEKVVMANGKVRPGRLTTWRFTTQSRVAADAVAALFGGEVRKWQSEWEVITNESCIGVTVPPRDQVVSQNYEMWNRGGAVRRCDSQFDSISGGPCLCPHAADPDDEDEVARKAEERAMLAARNPPEACKLVTRISVMIPDLPGLGVWRLDTGSYYAGVEIGDSAHLMEIAREQGIFLPAQLRIELRTRVSRGETKKYPVPVLEILATFRQIASGELDAGGIAMQLPPAPGRPQEAITAGREVMPHGSDEKMGSERPLETAPRPGHGALGEPATQARLTRHDEPAKAGHTGNYGETAGMGRPELDDEARYAIAQAIADRAAKAVTSAEFIELGEAMAENGCGDQHVCTDRALDVWEQLDEYLRGLWREKGRQA